MNTKWLGLWKQERQGFYAGQVIKKGDIPKYTRIVLRYNKYYEKDTNKPRFVYCFADFEGYVSKCVPIEIEEEEDNIVEVVRCKDCKHYGYVHCHITETDGWEPEDYCSMGERI